MSIDAMNKGEVVVVEEQPWNAARLIPTSGINGAEEQERRATSALLAVMQSVREFGRVLTSRYGAPNSPLQTFIEVPFQLGEKKVFPDGLIRARRGQKEWTALVEVKTGTNQLATQQLENYLDVAKEHGFDCVLTISNELAPSAGQHPTTVDKRKLRKVALHHLSWTEVVTEAVVQKEHRGVADPDQAWILGELIRYLEHPRSGALSFEDMGSSWVPIRDAVRARTLRATDPGTLDVVARFDALIRFACLQLGRRLGADVVPALTRAEMNDPSGRSQRLVHSLVEAGTMAAAIRIPHAVSPIVVTVDVRSGVVTCHMDVDAPGEGRSTTRVNWLVRQLKKAPENVRLESFAVRAREGAAELLATARDNPSSLILDQAKELKSFRVAIQRPLGMKRAQGRGGFIDSVLDAIDECYRDVGQNLKAWQPAAPKMRDDADVEKDDTVRSGLSSAALSSQDIEAS
ncbi:hypothetical protein GCM10011512_03210 [Tersicoccus solisilvae]|uniref:Stress response protein n=1 Tax=Tersicoccus solisilvae TaxID=1882339 RepID=A0ABQ1NL66_9MICC|nr:hypothetical protein [Tersicoccus solisilvae]GGC79925.1 hypothetical protein GCM10011512_03210 [Tersicoccus solisilvae]